jgi:uncharacterized protein YheU (UPF0270 family)
MTTPHVVVIPFRRLTPEALSGLLEAYVSREGTDYGLGKPLTLAEKVAQVRRQLEDGTAVVVFDPQHQSCNIVPKHLLSRESQ